LFYGIVFKKLFLRSLLTDFFFFFILKLKLTTLFFNLSALWTKVPDDIRLGLAFLFYESIFIVLIYWEMAKSSAFCKTKLYPSNKVYLIFYY
jgi:hypothetical protein